MDKPSSQLNKMDCLEKWAIHLCVATLALIIFATLYPFDFQWPSVDSDTSLFSYFYLGISVPGAGQELFRNLILLAPLGFSVSALLKSLQNKGWYNLIFIVAILLVSSLLIEILQLFLPGRTATVSDIIGRSLGGLFGIMCFHLWRAHILNFIFLISQQIRIKLSGKTLIYVYLSYFIFFTTVSISLQTNTHLRNWDPTFPLMIGNEATSDRPWQGYVSEVAIANQAIDPEKVNAILDSQDSIGIWQQEWFAHYSFSSTDNDTYPDLSGNLPALHWQGEIPESRQRKESAIFVSADAWLKADSVGALTEQLQNTSAFTLVTVLSTVNTSQSGPARIISMSDGSLARNFTIGQDGPDLIFRLRTPVTGNNGSSPEIAVSGILSDSEFHTIVLTYQKSKIRLYIDTLDKSYSIELTPDITGLQYFLPLRSWTIRADRSHLLYKVIYYSLLFMPLSLLLFLMYKNKLRKRQWR